MIYICTLVYIMISTIIVFFYTGIFWEWVTMRLLLCKIEKSLIRKKKVKKKRINSNQIRVCSTWASGKNYTLIIKRWYRRKIFMETTKKWTLQNLNSLWQRSKSKRLFWTSNKKKPNTEFNKVEFWLPFIQTCPGIYIDKRNMKTQVSTFVCALIWVVMFDLLNNLFDHPLH